ncbi:hypothetical protein BJX63DRAFT_430961 [Aspergillus granulosus]|uniref:Uncharacterized protein n=1 Tax=Aspergillus granulosus TaxID=176169 RepID=A0ABR4HI32_9EURO
MKLVVLALCLAFALVAVALPDLPHNPALANPTSDALDCFVWTEDEELDEEFDVEIPYFEPAGFGNTFPTTILNKATRVLEKRHTVYCDVGENTDPWKILKGIKKLRKVKGTPRAPARTCERVWCDKGTSLGWCNDYPDSQPTSKQSDESRHLPSYNNIADGIQAIINDCVRISDHTIVGGVSGEVDHPDKWRAIVHHTWGCKNR